MIDSYLLYMDGHLPDSSDDWDKESFMKQLEEKLKDRSIGAMIDNHLAYVNDHLPESLDNWDKESFMEKLEEKLRSGSMGAMIDSYLAYVNDHLTELPDNWDKKNFMEKLEKKLRDRSSGTTIDNYLVHLSKHLPASARRWNKKEFMKKQRVRLDNVLEGEVLQEEANYQALIDLACKNHWIAKGILHNQLYTESSYIIRINREHLRKSNILLSIPEEKQRRFEAQWQEIADLFLTEIESVANGHSCPGLEKIMGQEIDGNEPDVWMEDLRVLARDSPKVCQCP